MSPLNSLKIKLFPLNFYPQHTRCISMKCSSLCRGHLPLPFIFFSFNPACPHALTSERPCLPELYSLFVGFGSFVVPSPRSSSVLRLPWNLWKRGLSRMPRGSRNFCPNGTGITGSILRHPLRLLFPAPFLFPLWLLRFPPPARELCLQPFPILTFQPLFPPPPKHPP